jgi:hypothetical protein
VYWNAAAFRLRWNIVILIRVDAATSRKMRGRWTPEVSTHKEKLDMRPIVKSATVLGMAGALALASMTASQARVWPWAAAGIGLAAGAALASAAAANHAYYYGYGPGFGAYAYDPYYGPGYDAFAYSPGYVTTVVPVAPTAPARYRQPFHGYDTNYIGPLRERQLEGRDY